MFIRVSRVEAEINKVSYKGRELSSHVINYYSVLSQQSIASDYNRKGAEITVKGQTTITKILKSRVCKVAITYDFEQDLADYYAEHGLSGLLVMTEEAQARLINFVFGMVLYIKRKRIAYGKAKALQVIEQDEYDAQMDTYARVLTACNAWLNGRKDTAFNEIEKRLNLVAHKSYPNIKEIKDTESKKALLRAKALEIFEDFDLNNFGDFKYFVSGICGQIYDAYLMNSGRDLMFSSIELIESEDGGLELNSVATMLSRKAINFAKSVAQAEERSEILALNLESLSVYFDNKPNDLTKFNAIKERVIAEHGLTSKPIELGALVSHSEAVYLYRLRDRIEQFYRDLSTPLSAQEQNTSRRPSKAERQAQERKQEALYKAQDFVRLCNEVTEAQIDDSAFKTVQARAMQDLRAEQSARLEALRNKRESVYVQRFAKADLE